MKATFTVVLSLVIAVAIVAPCRSFAQTASDTMYVYSSPPGNLNNVIMGDTTSTGQRADPNRVYVLVDTGSVDSIYYVTATMNTDFNLTIIGMTNPNTGHPSVIEPYTSSVVQFFAPSAGQITMKNLYLLSRMKDGSTDMKYIFQAPKTAKDSIRIDADHCVFDDFNSYMMVVNSNYWFVSITNSEFRDDPNINGGALWVNSSHPIDTLEFVNDTFFDIARANYGDLGWIGYLLFDHNTSFLGAWNPIWSPQLSNAVIENNIFYGMSSLGADSVQLAGALANPGKAIGSSVIALDTLTTLLSSPYNLTAADRNIVVKDNVYYWPDSLYGFWDNLKDPTTKVPMKITKPQFFDKEAAMMFGDHTEWPGLVASNNDSVDPGFSSSLVTSAVDSLVQFLSLTWSKGSAGSYRPCPYITDPPNVFA